MAVRTQETPPKRTPLNRERVLRAAIALADERGAQELTMRKLAKELGVEAMSLYNHVANKDDLLDGMIDLVFGEIEAPSPSGDWKAELRKRAISTREALTRHRWAIGEMEGRTNHGPNNLRLHNAVLGCLRAAGFSAEMTVHAYSVQDAYIYGFVLQQSDMSSETPEDFAAEAQRQMRDYAAALADYPHLVEVVGGYVAESGYHYEAEFLFGLDVVLDRLEQLLSER
ncbi:MAG TPA: TetR/AcrR family transcriptional regulator C-terminal domain-containing protein [Reyranella sp.]|nr:TetR/AcrR family transcriptional regulator C-terminal domain-containing protein [Reyranella sp.]